MSQTYIPQSLRRQVVRRANQRCEYCHLAADSTFIPHEIDHIIAEQHGGKTAADNLALACFDCNKAKGPNIASIDPHTDEVIRLFHPRRDKWAEHFQQNGYRIDPLTQIGRATAMLLKFNDAERVLVRQSDPFDG